MFLCQMSGIPGTGKSSLARQICKTTNAILLDVDIIKTSVLNKLENNINFNLAGKVAYEIVFALTNCNLEIGNSVVIDSPCSYDIIIEQGTALTKKYNIPYKFIECYLDLKLLSELNRRRVEREILPSQKLNTPIDEDEYKTSTDGLKRPAEYEYLLIDTSPDIKKYIGTVIEYLNKRPE